MTVRLRPLRIRLAILAAIIALLWVVMAVSVRGWIHLLPDDSSDVRVPLTGAGSVQFSLWSRDTAITFWPDASGSARRPGYDQAQSTGSLSVAIWYQDFSGTQNTRLALFKLPAWALGLVALNLIICAGCLALRFGRRLR